METYCYIYDKYEKKYLHGDIVDDEGCLCFAEKSKAGIFAKSNVLSWVNGVDGFELVEVPQDVQMKLNNQPALFAVTQ